MCGEGERSREWKKSRKKFIATSWPLMKRSLLAYIHTQHRVNSENGNWNLNYTAQGAELVAYMLENYLQRNDCCVLFYFLNNLLDFFLQIDFFFRETRFMWSSIHDVDVTRLWNFVFVIIFTSKHTVKLSLSQRHMACAEKINFILN